MWNCPKCREENDDGYEVCWNCGTSKSGEEDPGFHTAEETTSQTELADARPIVEVIPRTNVPEALQPREPDPVPHPRWKQARCPGCASQDLARDTASPWPVIVSFLVLGVALAGEGLWRWTGLGLGSILLALSLLAPFFTDNVWCRACGLRFKKRYRIERPARG